MVIIPNWLIRSWNPKDSKIFNLKWSSDNLSSGKNFEFNDLIRKNIWNFSIGYSKVWYNL